MAAVWQAYNQERSKELNLTPHLGSRYLFQLLQVSVPDVGAEATTAGSWLPD